MIDRGPLSLAEVQADHGPALRARCSSRTSSGVLHRDLKPANIVAHDFGGGTRAHKIVDFGLARVRESTDATRLTGAHQFLGTITYAAPEQTQRRHRRRAVRSSTAWRSSSSSC